MRAFFFIITIFTASYATALQTNTARPLPLTEQQNNAILNAHSIAHSQIIDKKLWFTSAGRVWSWSLDHKQLRYQDISKFPGPITGFTPYPNGFITTNDQGLLFVQRKPFGVFSIQQPNTTLAIQTIKDQTWWIRTDGASLVDPTNHSVDHKHTFKGLQPNDKVALTTAPLTLWIARDKELLAMEKNKTQIRYRKIMQTQSSITNLSFDGSDIYATTQNEILRFEPQGLLIQKIPMRGAQSILESHITADQHTYLLSSRVVEIYSQQNKTVKRYRLPIKNAKSVRDLRLQGTYISVIIDQVPRVFQIEGSLASKKSKKKHL